MPPWHDDPDFWDLFGTLLVESPVAEVQRTVAGLIACLAPVPGARVLDLGCGSGQHALELARYGYAVTAVERWQPLLEPPRRHAQDAGLDLELIQGDPRVFRRPRAFDLVCSLSPGLGAFTHRRNDLRILQTALANLAPRGRLVVRAQGQEVWAKRGARRTTRPMETGRQLVEARSIRRDWSALDLCWTLVDDARTHQTALSLRLYTGPQLTALLQTAGFSQPRLLGSPHGAPYDHRAEGLWGVASRGTN